MLLKAINSLFIITLKDFEKRLTIKSWFCQEFHFTYNNSHKLLRPSQFLKTSWKFWNGLLCIRPPPSPYLSTNTEACAKKLPQLLAIKIDNEGGGGLILEFMWVIVDSSRKSSVFKSIIKYLVSYCPRISMFCSRTSNNMINKIHECLLRVI